MLKKYTPILFVYKSPCKFILWKETEIAISPNHTRIYFSVNVNASRYTSIKNQ